MGATSCQNVTAPTALGEGVGVALPPHVDNASVNSVSKGTASAAAGTFFIWGRLLMDVNNADLRPIFPAAGCSERMGVTDQERHEEPVVAVRREGTREAVCANARQVEATEGLADL